MTFTGRTDGQRRQTAHPPVARRLDRGDEGSFALRTVGTHRRRHRRRFRDPSRARPDASLGPMSPTASSARPPMPLPDFLCRARASPETGACGLKQWLGDCDRRLARAFRDSMAVTPLVRTRAEAVRQLVVHAWVAIVGEAPGLPWSRGGGWPTSSFPAVRPICWCCGRKAPTGSLARSLETLFACLWDLGLKPGHALRTPAQCRTGRTRHQRHTSLLDGVRIAGSTAFDAGFAPSPGDERLCSRERFFLDKRGERCSGMPRFNDTAYNLEPNLKDGPGGLRSLQLMAGWDAGCSARHSLPTWSVTVCWHRRRSRRWTPRATCCGACASPCICSPGGPERLLFDYQRRLAAPQLRRRARAEPRCRTVHAGLLPCGVTVARQRTVPAALRGSPRAGAAAGRRGPCPDGFVALGAPGYAWSPICFARRPGGADRNVRGAGGESWGNHRSARRRPAAPAGRAGPGYGGRLRDDADANAAFLRLLRLGAPAVEALADEPFGVLAAYLPAFGRVVGRMQCDLFHVYTVDRHTLRVLRIVARYASGRDLARVRPRPCGVLAPGQTRTAAAGGPCSTIFAKGAGATIPSWARRCARFHGRLGLAAPEVDLVAWLVRWHLLMSVTAQRQDITDPDVVHRFAVQVADWGASGLPVPAHLCGLSPAPVPNCGTPGRTVCSPTSTPRRRLIPCAPGWSSRRMPTSDVATTVRAETRALLLAEGVERGRRSSGSGRISRSKVSCATAQQIALADAASRQVNVAVGAAGGAQRARRQRGVRCTRATATACSPPSPPIDPPALRRAGGAS